MQGVRAVAMRWCLVMMLTGIVEGGSSKDMHDLAADGMSVWGVDDREGTYGRCHRGGRIREDPHGMADMSRQAGSSSCVSRHFHFITAGSIISGWNLHVVERAL